MRLPRILIKDYMACHTHTHTHTHTEDAAMDVVCLKFHRRGLWQMKMRRVGTNECVCVCIWIGNEKRHNDKLCSE